MRTATKLLQPINHQTIRNMGKRGGKKFRGGRGGGGGGRGGWKGGSNYGTRQNYQEVDKKNAVFENYYNELGILDESEQEEFWAALRRELPNSFRFAGSKGHALSVKKRLVEHYIPEITKMTFNGQPVDPPTAIPWYPNQLAYQMTTPKNVVRKFAPFSSFQKFLVSETTVGNISRQEIVSMIPPLLMDVKPGMTVLDLCAAPGSKSAQLVEMVHGGEEARVRRILHSLAKEQGREMSPDGIETTLENDEADKEGDWSDDGRSTGLLIANDVEYRRAQLLVHQTKRLNSPNLIVTNHDATMFPSIRVPSEPGQPLKYLKFDRILADVPCSGDGTARKNPNIWKDWGPGNALGLHPTQTRILVRALQMLKVGGRVVYSTCSMNPVENEAVVSAAIDRCGGNSKVRVVDVSNELVGLKRKDGLKNWKIIDRRNRVWSSWAEVEAAKAEQGNDDGFGRLTENMFPLEGASEEERIPLERCVRVYPHLQDTGGFFITALEKLDDIRARPEKIPSAPKGPKADAGNTPTIIDEEAAPTAEGVANNGQEEVLPDANENASEELAPPSKRELEDDEEDGGVPLSPSGTKRVKVDHEAPVDGSTSNGQSITKNGASTEATNVESVGGSATPATPATPAGKLSQETTTKRKPNQPHEEPFKYLDPAHETLVDIFRFYSINEKFPRDRFMVRNAMGEPVKTIYYTSTLCREILTLNEGSGLKFIHCGVKMFNKQDSQGQDICRWRIQAEGIPIVEGWVGEERVVRLFKRDTLRKLLKEMFPKVNGDGWVTFEELEKGFGERVRDIGMGCCVLRVERSDAEDGFQERLVLPLWRSLHSLNLMLPKEERKAMLIRLFNDEEPLIDHSQIRHDKDNTTSANGSAETTVKDTVEQNGPTEGEAADTTNGESESKDIAVDEDGDVEMANEGDGTEEREG